MLNVLFYGLPVDELQSFRERVNAVTVDDIERVARAYLRPDRLSIVLVGNAAAFASQLRGIGFGTFETVNMADLDLTAADFKAQPAARAPAAGRRLGSAPSAGGFMGVRRAIGHAEPACRESMTPAPRREALLDRVIAAKGGLETLRADQEHHGGHDVTGDGDAPGPFRRRRRRTCSTRIACASRPSCPMRRSFRCSTDSVAGSRIRDGVHDVPDRAVQDLQGEPEARHDRGAARGETRASARAAAARRRKTRPASRYQRARTLGSRSRSDGALRRSRDASDREGRPTSAGGVGQPLIEEVFSDYKPVDGVQIAFTANGAPRRRGGARAAGPRHRHQRPDRSRALHTSCLLTARLLLSCGEPSAISTPAR